MLQSSKVCTKCGESKAPHAFHKDNRNKDGRTASCGVCRTEYQKSFQQIQKETNLEYYKRWRKSNNYSSKYGLSLEQVEEKLKLQNYKCPICECSLALNGFAVDHNHATHKVRDLLCAPCNKGLGFFYESKRALKNAITYLETHDDSIN